MELLRNPYGTPTEQYAGNALAVRQQHAVSVQRGAGPYLPWKSALGELYSLHTEPAEAPKPLRPAHRGRKV